MRVAIDSREQSRIEQAEKYFQEQGLDTVVKQLKTGDYLFENRVVFEYKTEQDFITSITDKRVFNEALNQSEEYPYHFVIIQGTPEERKNALFKAHKFHQFTHKQYYNAIAMLNTYTTIIHTQGTVKTAFKQMLYQANKCIENKLVQKQFRSKKASPAYNFLRMCIHGVGEKTAKTLCAKHALYSLSDILQLKQDDIEGLPHIGKKRAKEIMRQIGEMA